MIAGEDLVTDAHRIEAALDAVHARQHLSAIILMAPSARPRVAAGRPSTYGAIRRWAERRGIVVQSWFFAPTGMSLERWLMNECQADMVMALPGETFGLPHAARHIGLTVVGADGVTPIVGRPRRQTLRMFPCRMRPGRALRAAA